MNIEKQTTQIVQIKLFDEFCDQNPELSSLSRLMWYQLQVIFNNRFWPEHTRINNKWFRFKLGMSEKESDKRLFNRIRKELTDHKLIGLRPGKRGKDPEYTLNYFIGSDEGIMVVEHDRLNDVINDASIDTPVCHQSDLGRNPVQDQGRKTASIVGYVSHNQSEKVQSPEYEEYKQTNKCSNTASINATVAHECTIRARENKNKNKNKNKNIYNTQTVIRDTEKPGSTPGEPPGMTDEDIPETATEPETSAPTPNQPEESLRSVRECGDGVPVTGEDLQLAPPGIPAAEKKRERLDDDKCEELREFYNDHRGGMVKCRKMNRRRRSLLNARVMEYDEDTVRSVMVAAGRNSFYGGSGPRGWRADIEWILKSSNFDKIYERDLDSGGGSTQDFLDLAARAYSQGGGFDTAGSSAADRTAADQLSGEFLEFSIE